MDELSRKFVKVRKKRNGKLHQCCQCNRDIPVDTEVECGVYAGGDGIYAVYTCKPCLGYISEFGGDLYDPWDDTLDECAVINHIAGCMDKKDAHWLKIKTFGYGDEKWD